MNLVTIAYKSLRQRSLASILTSLSVALGVMLMVAVLVIYGIVSNIFGQNSVGYDLIVGPKGSELQLVLSTIYRVSPPIENLPYRFYREFKERKGIEAAIPVALGDTTEKGNFPICGTTPDYFKYEYAPRREFSVRGDFFRKPFQAVIGAQVARENGWDLGTKLKLVHGGAASGGHVHDEEFDVVGVLAPTGTPNDKTVFVHLSGFYAISGHDKPLGEAIIRERAFYNEPPLTAEELEKAVAVLDKQFGHHHEHKPGTQHFHDIAEVQKEVTP
ncbi:MAG: ABC transporter permease [Planctomycetaceae bacterium]